MSCLYGPRQFGTEDQGWVAHFLIAANAGREITIYGDGRQVRDVLYVDDAVDAYLRTLRRIGAVAGSVFNLGGGPTHAISLRELLALIRELTGVEPKVRFDAWRTGDQRWYVSDSRKLEAATGWRARTPVRAGIRALHRWLTEAPPPAPARKKERVPVPHHGAVP
jgi:CDP-paratose 2-epimerase